MKRILVINANPKLTSLCKSLAEQYAAVAIKKHDVKHVNIGDLNFEINLAESYDKVIDLEPCLADLQEKILWSEHIVIVSPVWWGTMPAKFKGAIDRVFLPGFSFKYVEGKSIPQKLLEGRTSELLVTLDTPVFWYKYIQGNVIYKNFKHCILDFSGIKNKTTTYFGPVINSSSDQRKVWLEKAARLGAKVS